MGLSFNLLYSVRAIGQGTDGEDLVCSLCPTVHVSKVYYALVALASLFIVLCIGFFIRNIRMGTHTICFSNGYLMIGAAYGILNILQLLIPAKTLSVSFGYFLCLQLPLYLLFLALLLLIAFLHRIASTMQAVSQSDWRRTVIRLVAIAVTVFILFVLGTVLCNVFTEGQFDPVQFVRPAVIVTLTVFAAALCWLLWIACSTFRLLNLLLVHNYTRLIVRRIRIAFIIILACCTTRLIWQLLVVCNVPISPEEWLDTPDKVAGFGVCFRIVMDYVPLSAALFAFLPRAVGHERARRRRGYDPVGSDGGPFFSDRSDTF